MSFHIDVAADFIRYEYWRRSSGVKIVTLNQLLHKIETISSKITSLYIHIDVEDRSEVIINVLDRLPTLKDFFLELESVDVVTWERICARIASHKRLQTIDFTFRPSSLEIVEMLCSACARAPLTKIQFSTNANFDWSAIIIPILRRFACSKSLKSFAVNCSGYLPPEMTSDISDALQNNYSIIYCPFALIWYRNDRMNNILQRNRSLVWEFVHETIVRYAIAMVEACDMPLYVVLAVVDTIPYYVDAHAQYKKVALLERIFASIKRIGKRKRGERTINDKK